MQLSSGYAEGTGKPINHMFKCNGPDVGQTIPIPTQQAAERVVFTPQHRFWVELKYFTYSPPIIGKPHRDPAAAARISLFAY